MSDALIPTKVAPRHEEARNNFSQEWPLIETKPDRPHDLVQVPNTDERATKRSPERKLNGGLYEKRYCREGDLEIVRCYCFRL